MSTLPTSEVFSAIRPFLDRSLEARWQADDARRTRPVFIIGIHRRSGTNFLADALQLTSELALPLPIAEDYLLEYSNLLIDFARLTAQEQYAKRFRDSIEGFHQCTNSLLREIGHGLLRFLSSYIPPGKRLLTKTPDPWNLPNFFALFPEALLILIVRDGRDCVESSKWAFPGRSYIYWMTTWAINARSILGFLSAVPAEYRSSVILTRYEDLLSDSSELRRVLNFLGIDPSGYPWDRFDRLPVRGSTFFRGNADKIHWRPVEKTAEFRPVGRWKTWSWWLRFHFKKIAGRELQALGYSW